MLLTLAFTVLLPLSPYYPDPDPGYTDTPGLLSPSYVVNGDGTRWQCTPGGFSCARDTTGLPSYLTPTP